MRQRAWTQQQRTFRGRSCKNIVPEPRSQRLNVAQPVLKTQYCCLKRYQLTIAFRYLSRVVGFHGDNQNLGSRELGGPFSNWHANPADRSIKLAKTDAIFLDCSYISLVSWCQYYI